MVRVVVDAMGGDFAPKQQVLGAVDALNADKDLKIILVGDKEQIEAELAPLQFDTVYVPMYSSFFIISSKIMLL